MAQLSAPIVTPRHAGARAAAAGYTGAHRGGYRRWSDLLVGLFWVERHVARHGRR